MPDLMMWGDRRSIVGAVLAGAGGETAVEAIRIRRWIVRAWLWQNVQTERLRIVSHPVI